MVAWNYDYLNTEGKPFTSDLTQIGNNVAFAGIFTVGPDQWGFIGLNNTGTELANKFVLQHMDSGLL